MNTLRPLPLTFLSAILVFSVLIAGLASVVARAQSGNAHPSPAAATVKPASGRCGTCHPAERTAFETSIHAGEDVHCTSCHGGNDNSLEQAVAHGSGFRGKPARETIPSLCASCHADEQKMRAYNLPVDQYALYQMSGHGERLKNGDKRVAVCSDCHGAHDILAPSDPASRVFTTNIPRTCGRCHGDTTLVKERGITNVFALYENSVHGRQLHDKGNLGAPTCVSCHGVHGAAPPEVGDINKVCGRCHTAERRWFLAGPHKDAMKGKGLGECSSCHNAHDVQPARSERLGSQCVDCHAQDSREAAAGRQLDVDYRAAADEVAKAEGLVVKAEAVPLRTDDYRARLEEAHTYLREALTAGHAVQPQVLADLAIRARTVGQEVQHDIQGKLGNIRTERLLLVVFWFYVLGTASLLRRLRDRGRRAKE
jgi:predicted CXXCH cytochrome family protein